MNNEINYYEQLLNKIEKKTATIAVLGLGYVGLPHAVHYSREKFSVLGIDIDKRKIQSLLEGKSYIDDISNETIEKFILHNKVTTDYSVLEKADVIFIDIPTPIDKYQKPDLSALSIAISNLFSYLTPGKLIILESTSFPTTTYQYIIEPLQQTGVTIGKDLFVAFSPERIDPGNINYSVENTPKLVGGYTKKCTKLAAEVIGKNVVEVSSPEVAELAKLYENTFRFVNIGLADELNKVCRSLEIDTHEVLDAAETKPFGFMRFNPNVKIGGHCIGVDPYYLKWFMEGQQITPSIINATSQTDKSMISFCIERIMDILVEHRVPVFEAKIAFLGVTYKKNISDTRMSAAPELLQSLLKYNARVDLYDDFASSLIVEENVHSVLPINYDSLSEYDVVIILTDHDSVDYERVFKESRAILDTKHVFKASKSEKYYYL